MCDLQCVIDLQLLKDCLYAFNEIPNKRLGNGIKTYDIASQLDNVFRNMDSTVYFTWTIDDVQAIHKELTDGQALVVLEHLKSRQDIRAWIKRDLLNVHIEKLFPLLK